MQRRKRESGKKRQNCCSMKMRGLRKRLILRCESEEEVGMIMMTIID